MSAPKPAREAIAVTRAERMPRPGATRTAVVANLSVGALALIVLLLLAVAVGVTS